MNDDREIVDMKDVIQANIDKGQAVVITRSSNESKEIKKVLDSASDDVIRNGGKVVEVHKL